MTPFFLRDSYGNINFVKLFNTVDEIYIKKKSFGPFGRWDHFLWKSSRCGRQSLW